MVVSMSTKAVFRVNCVYKLTKRQGYFERLIAFNYPRFLVLAYF